MGVRTHTLKEPSVNVRLNPAESRMFGNAHVRLGRRPRKRRRGTTSTEPPADRHLPVRPGRAVLFSQLTNALHQHASTVLTSNKSFDRCPPGVLGDDVMAAALKGRLRHHSHVVNIRGNGYPGACPSESAAIHGAFADPRGLAPGNRSRDGCRTKGRERLGKGAGRSPRPPRTRSELRAEGSHGRPLRQVPVRAPDLSGSRSSASASSRPSSTLERNARAR